MRGGSMTERDSGRGVVCNASGRDVLKRFKENVDREPRVTSLVRVASIDLRIAAHARDLVH